MQRCALEFLGGHEIQEASKTSWWDLTTGGPGGQTDGDGLDAGDHSKVIFGSEFILDWSAIEFPCKFFIYKILA